MAGALIDSDILIDVLRRTPGIANRLGEYSTMHELATTAVTAFEVFRGAQSNVARQAFSELLAQFVIVDLAGC